MLRLCGDTLKDVPETFRCSRSVSGVTLGRMGRIWQTYHMELCGRPQGQMRTGIGSWLDRMCTRLLPRQRRTNRAVQRFSSKSRACTGIISGGLIFLCCTIYHLFLASSKPMRLRVLPILLLLNIYYLTKFKSYKHEQ